MGRSPGSTRGVLAIHRVRYPLLSLSSRSTFASFFFSMMVCMFCSSKLVSTAVAAEFRRKSVKEAGLYVLNADAGGGSYDIASTNDDVERSRS